MMNNDERIVRLTEAMAQAKEVLAEAHRDGAADKAEAVKAEYEATVDDAMRGCSAYALRPSGSRAYASDFVFNHCAEGYRKRTAPPPADVASESSQWSAGYARGETHGREQGFVEGRNEGAADKAEAVQAEHEHTLGDMDLLGCLCAKETPECTMHSLKWVRTRMDDRYTERTIPPPAEVTVRMSHLTLAEIKRSYAPFWGNHIKVVDPAGDAETSDAV